MRGERAIDWHSRCVLSRERPKSLDASLCVRALERSLAEHGTSESFNTDYGCQFISAEFAPVLLAPRDKDLDGRLRRVPRQHFRQTTPAHR